MVLDANTQVGDRQSNTNIHVFEFHSTTAGWAVGFIVFLAVFTLGLRWRCRRKYKKRLLRQTGRPEPNPLGEGLGRLLALTHQRRDGGRCKCCRTHLDIERGSEDGDPESRCAARDSGLGKIRLP
jgi:hypothetical protein